MAQQPRISLCMIARNEEQLIAQAIRSVQSIVHETILVDTGSTDNTIQVAQCLGAKIFQVPWENDFSKPRNISLAKATGDWILVLDADEAIAERDLELLRSYTLADPACYEFMQRHYSNDHRISQYVPVSGEYPEFERSYQGYFESNLSRFFPNGRGIEYRGRIHELVEHSVNELKTLKIIRAPIPIHHYGHTDEVKAVKNKHKLYAPLGEAKLKDAPRDWKGFFELGVEYINPETYEQSVTAFRQSIALNPGYLNTWVNLGYVLCELGRNDEARNALLQALRLDPRSHEAACNVGVVELREGRLDHAERYFRHAISLNAKYVNAYLNLAKTLANASRFSEAVLTLRRARDIAPRNSGILAEMALIYKLSGVDTMAAKLTEQALALDASNQVAQWCKAQLETTINLTGDATDAVNAAATLLTPRRASERSIEPPE